MTRAMSKPAAKATPDMRGWPRITLGSLYLSTFGELRKNMQRLYEKMPDNEPCMFELTLRFPPKVRRITPGRKRK